MKKYVNGKELVKRILEGEEDFREIALPKYTDLTTFVPELNEYLRKKDFAGIDFSNSELIGIVAPEIILNRASLNYASLDEASLDEASLNYASLDEASLNYASLDEANIWCAKTLEKICLAESKGISFFQISGIGSRNDITTFILVPYKIEPDNSFEERIRVDVGCYNSRLPEFLRQVGSTHDKNNFSGEYLSAVEYAKNYFKSRGLN